MNKKKKYNSTDNFRINFYFKNNKNLTALKKIIVLLLFQDKN
jgi:predicted phage tail protein